MRLRLFKAPRASIRVRTVRETADCLQELEGRPLFAQVLKYYNLKAQELRQLPDRWDIAGVQRTKIPSARRNLRRNDSERVKPKARVRL